MLGFSPLASAPIGAKAATGGTLYLSATDTKDTASVSASITASASLSVTEASDTASVNVSITASISLAATEATDTASLSATATTIASLAATEAQDTASGSAQIDPALAALAAAETQDTAAISAAIVASVTLSVTEAQDTASAVISAVNNLDLIATEAPDVADFTTVILNDVRLEAVEEPDTAAISTDIVATDYLAAVETPDSASVGVIVQWGKIPDGPSVWTPQANGQSYWQDIKPALPPSNVTHIGGALGCSTIGGIAVGDPTSLPPSGGAIGVLWTQPDAGIVYWDKIDPLEPQANNHPTVAIGGAPLGGIATADGQANTPSEMPVSPIWTPVASSFTPSQEAA